MSEKPVITEEDILNAQIRPDSPVYTMSDYEFDEFIKGMEKATKELHELLLREPKERLL